MTPLGDPSLQLLLNSLAESASQQTSGLWLADEHHTNALPLLAPFRDNLRILSNRFDIDRLATECGLTSQFNDWEINDLKQFDRIYLRCCKEKPVNLHLLRLAYSRLAPEGRLILAGEKNEGIKSLAKLAEAIFQHPAKVTKAGMAYSVELVIDTNDSPQQALDLSEYHNLETIGRWRNSILLSKVGVFGWNKIDQGSQLLIETLEAYVEGHSLPTDSLLDLGCGYGFLTIASASIPAKRRVATDNNAAALKCVSANARQNSIEIDVLAGDCGDTINEKFDLVLCNPPFHKGFDVQSDLTQRFVNAAATKTQKNGSAFFVVNSFIGIEQKARKEFRIIETLANNGQFKVVLLQH